MKKWQIFIVWIALAITFLMLDGCTTTRFVEVPTVREVVAHQRDTLTMRDSIFMHDSVTVTHWGDTILKQEYHVIYRDRWRDRLRVDSFIQRDTLTVVKEVEKPPNRWQQTKMCLGSTLLWLLAAAIVFFLARAIIYRYKRG